MSHCSPWGWKVHCLSGWTASTMPVASSRSTFVCPRGASLQEETVMPAMPLTGVHPDLRNSRET